ncbi:cytosine permease [Solirubrobacter taibaiensis]|nr:cytosine permease [Solirubrobacter taibaiensis]
MATITHAVPLTRAGRIEETGVAYIPEAERDSRPANLATVFFGGNLAFSVIVFGWLPVTFGLGWWATVSASALGLAIGTLITAPLALLGPRTGTNNTVASGAHFGVRGRLLGSGLTIAFALAYAAIAVWTSGDALVAAAHRLLGTEISDPALALGYALIAAEITLVALYGHATVVAVQRFVVPVVGVLLLLGIPAFAGDFSAGGSGEYLLGGFWPTWALVVTIAAAGPLSYAPSLGDYTRRISRRHGDARVLTAAAFGVFGGLLVATLFGAFTALAIGAGDSYVGDLVAAAPAWYVLPILFVALAGGVGQGVLNLYASGLDLEALVPRLRRVHTTLITSAAAIVLLYLGTFALDAVDSITAMTLVLNGVAVPWVVVNLLGFLVARRRRYDPHDLQVFNEGRTGGRYWFTGGWNLRALLAWVCGSIAGLSTVATDLYTGPFADLAGGVDLSLAASALVAAAVYLIALKVVPE